jgi:hypothetical protein
MQTKLWVKYKNNNSTQVSTEDCQDVDDFLEACTKKLSHLLGSYDSAQLSLSTTDGGTALQPGYSLHQIPQNTDENPLFITATDNSPRLKSFRQERYKLSVEASCRKYLDALAFKLSTYYIFKQKSKMGATFGDVLEAITIGKKDTKPRWSHILETDTYEQVDDNGDMVQINAGDPKFPTPLPSLFTPDEWAKLRVFNNSTSTRIHSAILASTSNGKAYVVLPHSEFTEEMISFLKNIGVKATLFSSPDDLEVKDEDVLFEGSSLK